MITVRDVYNAIDRAAPFCSAESWDNCGILVGNADKEVKKILTALDITCDVAREAIENDVSLVVSHHPVIFKGLKELDDQNPAVMLAKAGVAAICAHTNVDVAENGLNSYLCEILGFEKIEGTPLDYDDGVAIGVVCESKNEISDTELAEYVKEKLGCETLRYSPTGKAVKRVGICTGSGGEFISGAVKNGCDALVTGDVKHNVFVEAKNSGICVVDAGHYRTECIFSELVKNILGKSFDGLEISRAKNDIPPFEVV